jgi:hypothetical protein
MDTTTPRSYARVRFRAAGKAPRSILLEVTRESDRFLTGYEVDRAGERIWREGVFDERLHLIEKSVITRRTAMRMNLHYGELEAAR